MTTSRTPTVLLGALLVAGLLCGCGAAGDDDAAAASTATTSGPAAPDPAAGSEWSPPGTRAARKGRGPGYLVLTDVRVADRDGFDRVVLRFRGRARAGYGVEFVRRAVREGVGDVVRLDGEAVLQVFASRTTYPARGYYDGPRRLAPDTDGPVAEVYVGATWEGYTQLFVGVDGGRSPFRVSTRTSPPRLVVDVADR